MVTKSYIKDHILFKLNGHQFYLKLLSIYMQGINQLGIDQKIPKTKADQIIDNVFKKIEVDPNKYLPVQLIF